ncbi:MAG: adenosylcobinamide-GDP ribazoletransferase [Thermomicrobiales bacterium]
MALLVALTLLTLVRVPLPRATTARDHGAAVAWYPAVGYLLGGALALLDLGLRHTRLSAFVIAALLVAALALLTGFLHLDGLIDTCDAVFVQRTRAERLRIARDPRAGAFGAIGVMLLLSLKVALLAGPLTGSRASIILCFPALARLIMAAAVVLLPAAHDPSGLGGAVKEHTRRWTLPVAVLVAVVPACVLLRWEALALIAGTLIGGTPVAILALRRLGGTTGDIYGAICECAEVGALIAAALLTP